MMIDKSKKRVSGQLLDLLNNASNMTNFNKSPKQKFPRSSSDEKFKPQMQKISSTSVAPVNFEVNKNSYESSEDNPTPFSSSSSIEILTVIEQTHALITIDDLPTPSSCDEESGLPGRKRSAKEILQSSISSKQQKLTSSNTGPSSAQVLPQDVAFLQTSITNDAYRFNYPSKKWLEDACKKLGLIYSQNAYKFWGNIDIAQITDVSKVQYIQQVKGGKDSCYRALSFLISGNENEGIKNAIREYFYDNFNTLGSICGYDFGNLTVNDSIVKDTILAEQITPILWEMIAKWLHCRVGIFEDEKLVKYGNWNQNDDAEIMALLFEKYVNDYNIITCLN